MLNTGGKVIISFWAEKRGDKYQSVVLGTSHLFGLRSLERGESLINSIWGNFYIQEEIYEEALAAGYRVVHYNNEPYGHAVLESVD